MLFSVIIPTYNRLPLLPRTLESIWAQRFTDFEVIIVDDGSTDGTREQLKALGKCIQFLTQTNRGPGAARNLGLQHATGEYIAFLDSDDLWFPWTLDGYARVIRETNSPAFVVGKPLRFDKDEALKSVTSTALTFKQFADYFASGDQWRWWGVSSFVIRADALRAAGGFAEKEMNGEDGDLALKLGSAGGFVQIMSPFTFAYREHAGNLTHDLSKSLAGVWHKVREERAGHYPGGGTRALERWRILTRHVRPVALECLRAGNRNDAWQLYRATFAWHLALRRWKFLVGFPLKALVS